MKAASDRAAAPSGSEPGLGRFARAIVLTALGGVVLCLLSLRIPLSSEIRYVEAAREMVEGGDWTVPHLAYVPYLEKPILLYWLAALSRSIFGDGSVAVRLPSICAAMGTLWVTFFAAWRMGGSRFATRATLVLSGSLYSALLGSALTTDPLFSFWLWAAWFAYWVSLEGSRSIWKWLFWLCLSLGFMTKGPLALILVLGSIGLYHIVDAPNSAMKQGWAARAWERVLHGVRASWRATRPWIGFVVIVATNLPWTIAVYRRDPRLLEFFYVRENFQAFFDGTIHHKESALFYVGAVCVALVPWMLPGLVGLARATRERIGILRRGGVTDGVEVERVGSYSVRSSSDRLRTYLFVVVAFTLSFLEISSAKLGSYILPIVPPLMLLVVDQWSAALARGARWMRWVPAANAALLLIAAGVYMIVDRERVVNFLDDVEPHFHAELVLILAAVGVGVLAGGIAAALGRFWLGCVLTGITMGTAAILVTWHIPELRTGQDGGDMARVIAQREKPGDLVVVSSKFVQDYTIHLALEHRVGFLGHTHELGMGHHVECTLPADGLPRTPYDVDGGNTPQNEWLFTEQRLAQEWRGARRIWLICTQPLVDKLTKAGVVLVPIAADGRVLLFSNQP